MTEKSNAFNLSYWSVYVHAYTRTFFFIDISELNGQKVLEIYTDVCMGFDRETLFGPTTMRLVLESTKFLFLWNKSFYRVWGSQPIAFSEFHCEKYVECQWISSAAISQPTQKRAGNLNGCANLCNCQGLHKTPNDGRKFNNLWLIHGCIFCTIKMSPSPQMNDREDSDSIRFT